MKTKKTDNAKKTHETNFSFPCGNFQKMAEMMNNCCPGEKGAIDCCSMMKRMMGRGRGAEAKGTKETRKAPRGGENG